MTHHRIGDTLRIFGRDCTIIRADADYEIAKADDGSREFHRKDRNGHWSPWLSTKSFPHLLQAFGGIR